MFPQNGSAARKGFKRRRVRRARRNTIITANVVSGIIGCRKPTDKSRGWLLVHACMLLTVRLLLDVLAALVSLLRLLCRNRFYVFGVETKLP